MKRSFFIVACISLLMLVGACKPKPKTGYVEVPTVTQNALCGIYSISPPKSSLRLYYEELGEGEPLILLHDHSLDNRMWNDVFFKLAKKYRVIRYDLRGYGKSDMPEVGFGFLHADDLKNFMDGLGIKKAHISGVSLGGMALAEFVALYPDRVLTATISSGALSGFPDRSAAPKALLKLYNDTIFKLKRQDVQKNLEMGIDSFKKSWKRDLKYMSGSHFRSIRKELFRMVDDWSAWQFTHPEVDPFIGEQADVLLAKQKQQPPILFLIGQYDSKGSKMSMQRMAALCKSSRVKILPDAGHFTCMESPGEFARELDDFIRKH
jgi:pimeloyl-ACP methyl ester carboxylesterase